MRKVSMFLGRGNWLSNGMEVKKKIHKPWGSELFIHKNDLPIQTDIPR
jgi:hypothetical protein